MGRLGYYFILGVLCVSNSAPAAAKIKFGLKAGYTLSQHYGSKTGTENYQIGTHFRHAAGGGALIYVPITEAFGMQHELLYVLKGSREDICIKDQPIQVKVQYDLDYLEIPTLFKFQVHQFKHIGIYGFSGFALSILLHAHYDLKGTVDFNDGGNMIRIPVSASNNMPDTDIFDYAFVYGGGLNFAPGKLPLFFEYRFTIGWNQLLLPTFSNQPPVALRNQSYLFVLGVVF
jgi:hypothetical protein